MSTSAVITQLMSLERQPVTRMQNQQFDAKAIAVQVGPGSYKLQITSTTTGAASDFTIADGGNATPLGALSELVHGEDALIHVGALGSPGRYDVTSASNTVTDLLPGVTLTL